MRVYVEAYGCSQNLGEAHRLEGLAREAGHELVGAPHGADAAVLVTCGVIGPTEARMVRRWRSLAEEVPRVIVTGCLVPLRTGLLTGPGLERTTYLPIRRQSELPSILAEPAPLVHPPARSAAVPPPEATDIAVEIPIAQGCTSHCTYCFSRLARGPLASLPAERVVEEVRRAVAAGPREVRLSSLDTSCWGSETPGGPRLPGLLAEVREVPGAFRVRVGMMSPQTLGPIADAYFPVLREAPFFRFLHLPVQSGSDAVLRNMRRGYTVEEFRRLLRSARRELPDLMLSTDLIVGFPTETEEEFQRSLDLVEEVEPAIVNVTRFSARPMTPAALLPALPSGRVKVRSRRLTELRTRTARTLLERWIGRVEEAFVTERGRGGSSVARLPNYLPVVLDSPLPLGTVRTVRIDGARSTYLLGHPVAG
jgi:threonylcarbamoyladenosine tRNA methylthiotransferase CDKAL1